MVLTRFLLLFLLFLLFLEGGGSNFILFSNEQMFPFIFASILAFLAISTLAQFYFLLDSRVPVLTNQRLKVKNLIAEYKHTEW